MKKIILIISLVIMGFVGKSQNMALFYYMIGDTCVHVTYNDTVRSINTDSLNTDNELSDFLTMINKTAYNTKEGTINQVIYQSAKVVEVPKCDDCDRIIICTNEYSNQFTWVYIVPEGFDNIILSESDLIIAETLFKRIIDLL